MSNPSEQLANDSNNVGASMNHLFDLEERIASLEYQLADHPAYSSYVDSIDNSYVLSADKAAQLQPFLTSIADLKQQVDALWRSMMTALSSEFDEGIRALFLQVDHEKLAQWLGRNENKSSNLIQSLTGHPDRAYKALGMRAVYWIGR